MNVGLFVPCYVDQFYPQVGIATLELLEKLGCKVSYPINQTCCGQPLANAGYQSLNKNTDQLFKDNFNPFEYVVCPSGSCTLHVKDHVPITGHIYELAEFLHDVLEIRDFSQLTFPHKVGLHSACHGLRGLNLAKPEEIVGEAYDKTKAILETISGLSLAALTYPNECCGFGGTFAIAEEALSVKMGQDRVRDHTDQGVEVICSGDMSCLMHMEGLLKRSKSSVGVMHIAEILNGRLP
jgi:L-lactate dehydrogenase complex protein LldE